MQKFVLSWQDAADWQWQEACRREAVIRPLAEQDPVSRQEAVAAAKQLGSVRGWFTGWWRVSDVVRRPARWCPGVRGRAARSRSLDPRVEALVASAIKKVYLRPERPRLIDLWRAVRAQCLPLGLKPPAYHTLQAGCNSGMRGWSCKRGPERPQRYDRVKPSLQASWPLEVVQIDHTPIDVLVVDEWERQPLGRPWLTLAIDVASRFVTRFQVSLDRPSSLTVALVLTQAVLPKDGSLSDRRLELSWPPRACPRRCTWTTPRNSRPKRSSAERVSTGCACFIGRPGYRTYGGHY
jgi:putative transposase